jgi:hypothetical protein
MSDRAFMFCPTCRNFAVAAGNPTLKTVELMQDRDALRCANGHTFPSYAELMAMNPEKIRMVPQDVRQPGDVKVDFWIDGQILAKFRERYPYQQNSTVQSIMSLYTTGQDPVIIDGVQAKKLNELGVRTGQECVAAIEVTKSLESEIDGLKAQLTTLTNVIGAKFGNGE